MRKIFGGEHPEILDRLQPLLDSFAANLDKKANAGTGELLAKAAKQFDPTDPTSPMAKHAAELRASQEQLTAQLDKNHTELANKVQELSIALKIQDAIVNKTAAKRISAPAQTVAASPAPKLVTASATATTTASAPAPAAVSAEPPAKPVDFAFVEPSYSAKDDKAAPVEPAVKLRALPSTCR
jgi:hypothetical protein